MTMDGIVLGKSNRNSTYIFVDNKQNIGLPPKPMAQLNII